LKKSGLLPRGGFTSREGFAYLEAVAERALPVAGQPALAGDLAEGAGRRGLSSDRQSNKWSPIRMIDEVICFRPELESVSFVDGKSRDPELPLGTAAETAEIG